MDNSVNFEQIWYFCEMSAFIFLNLNMFEGSKNDTDIRRILPVAKRHKGRQCPLNSNQQNYFSITSPKEFDSPHSPK